jgi:hypothetical protein
MKHIANITAVCMMAICMTACGHKTVPLPSGAINATDASINANLQTVRAGLAQYEADVSNGIHVPDATEKAFINKLIVASNTAGLIYCGAPSVGEPCSPGSYHAQLVSNPAAGEPQQLIDAMLAVTSNLTALQNLIKAVK